LLKGRTHQQQQQQQQPQGQRHDLWACAGSNCRTRSMSVQRCARLAREQAAGAPRTVRRAVITR
jgi:hypothetical protein